MARRLPELKPKVNFWGNVRVNGFWKTVGEMIGRTTEDGIFGIVRASMNLYASKQTVDYSKVRYALTRAIYYASETVDRIDGTKYGSQFLLGATFGKPIVNSTAAFILSKPVQIKMDDDYTEQLVNYWLKENHSYLQLAVRNSLRDGDSYPFIMEDGSIGSIAPEYVDKIVDPMNSNVLLGYDVSFYVKDDNNRYIKKYLSEYRKDGVNVFEIDGNKKTDMPEKTQVYKDNRPIPIVHFVNEPEANVIYGTSEFQSCYTLMANYHAVLESAIKGNIYNSAPVPYITGIENMQEFKEVNGKLNDDGQYVIEWDRDRIMLGGKGTTYGYLQSQDMTAGSGNLLNLIFWGICQTSETPEFIMGTAVASSKASTESQMPVMVAKAERKQGMYSKNIKELINVALWTFNSLDNKVNKDMEFQVIMPAVTGKDETIAIARAKFLLEDGVIQKETAGKMVGLEEYVQDITIEVEAADKQVQAKMDLEAALYPALGTVTKQNQTNPPTQPPIPPQKP